MTLTREEFVTAMTAFAAAGAAGGMAGRAGAAEADQWRTNAMHWGTFHAKIVNGRMTGVAPFAADANPNSLIDRVADLLYSPTRIKYPMIRKSFYEKRAQSDRTKRGAEPFVRVSWDEATEIVAAELQRVKQQHGNRAIYAGSYGWQSAGALHAARGAMQRMLSLHGGFVSYVNTYSAAVLPVISSHVLGDPSPAVSAWPGILDHAKLLVMFGYNPAVNAKVRDGGVGSHEDPTYLRAIKSRKIPVVSVNPITTETDLLVAAERIALRPNTDTALILALANVLIDERLYDTAFVAKYTLGFDAFSAYVLGKSDGIAKTPAWAASITGIEASTISALARRMAKNRTMLMGGYSLQRASHGAQPVWALITLAAMLGQIGLPGGGLQCGFPGGLGVPTGSAPAVPGLPAGINPVKDYVPINMWADLLLRPGKTIDYDGHRITYPEIAAVVWAGGNPFAHAQDVNRVIRAWQRPEVTIVADFNWTATAKHADIVLPATTSLERNDIVATDEYIIASQQIVKPMNEARNDFDIFGAVAARLGHGPAFSEGRDEMAWLRAFYARAQKTAPALPAFDTFWKRGFLHFPATAAAGQVVAYADFRTDPDANPLSTPSGKIELFSATIAGFKYSDSPGHAAWIEPVEWLGSPQAKRFPLHVLSCHPPDRLHSQLDATSLRTTYEVGAREPVWLNPADANKRGIRNGDIVRVFNERGQTLGGAVLTPRVRPNVIVIHEGGWYDPQFPGVSGTLDKHGSVNNLTTDAPDSKLAAGNPSNSVLVEVERYTAALPAITAFTAARTIAR